MNILLTICARGGSKGVKNKNIKLMAGKPLIAYTIKAAQKWGQAKRIICSTDSPEIAAVAKEYGVEVPFIRPAELATDTAGKVRVIKHALQECEKIYGERYDVVVDLDATSPLRKVQDLEGCWKLFQEKKPEIVFSVVPCRRNPYFNMVEIDSDGLAQISKRLEKRVLRRQDAPKVYDMNASIYFYGRDFLLHPETISPLSATKAAAYVMDEISATDVDSELDFHYIEFLIKNKIIDI